MRGNRRSRCQAAEPVADGTESFVFGTAGRAGLEMPAHRGPVLPTQGTDDARAEFTAPFGAGLAHLFLP